MTRAAWCVVLLISGPLWAEEPLVLDLAHVVQLAQSRSIEAIASQKRVAQALERMEQARGSLLPQISVSASQTRQTRNLESQGIALPGREPLVGPFNSFDARARLTQTLFDKSQLDRLAAARAGHDLSLAEQRTAREDVIALAAALYFDLRRAQAQKAAVMARAAQQEEQRRLARVLLQNGTGQELEVLQAQSAAAAAVERVQATDNALRQAELDLASALGFPSEKSFRLVGTESLPAPATLRLSSASVVETQPEVLVARQTLAARQADLSTSQADYWPRVSASADYGYSGKTPFDKERTYTYGAQASVPLFEGGRTRGRARESQRWVEEAQARLDDATRRAQARAESAWGDVEREWIFVSARREEEKAKRLALQVAQRRESNGTGTLLDVLRAQADFAESQGAVSEAENRYQLARVRYLQAIGRTADLSERKTP